MKSATSTIVYSFMKTNAKDFALMLVGLTMLVYVWLCLVGANPV